MTYNRMHPMKDVKISTDISNNITVKRGGKA
jgi:hypothetical protein